MMSSKGEAVLPSTLKEAISTVNTGGDCMSAADEMSGFGSRRSVGFLGFSLLGIGMRPELRMARYLEALKSIGVGD
jgi:hypothetical protein